MEIRWRWRNFRFCKWRFGGISWESWVTLALLFISARGVLDGRPVVCYAFTLRDAYKYNMEANKFQRNSESCAQRIMKHNRWIIAEKASIYMGRKNGIWGMRIWYNFELAWVDYGLNEYIWNEISNVNIVDRIGITYGLYVSCETCLKRFRCF